MPQCPKCRRYYGPNVRKCPDCGAAPGEGRDLDQELVPVLEPFDQMEALAAVALLEERGIDAVAKSEQIAMYDGLAMMMRPKWGKVLVLARDREKASEILDEYLHGGPDQGADAGAPGED